MIAKHQLETRRNNLLCKTDMEKCIILDTIEDKTKVSSPSVTSDIITFLNDSSENDPLVFMSYIKASRLP